MSIGSTTRAVVRRTLSKAWHDRILGLSAEAAFWQLLSLPSLFLALLASVGFVARRIGHDTINRVEEELEKTFSKAFSPEVVDQLVTPTVRQVLHGNRVDVISVGFILALWAGSSATATFVNTITIAYGMRDLRGAVRSRLLALWLFLGSVLIGVVVLPMLVLGPSLLTDVMPHDVRKTAHSVINDLYYPVVVVLLLLGLTSLYHLAPPRRLPWHRGLPGALIAMVVFLAGSAALRAYIAFILRHNHAYGTLAAPIAALLYFYLLALGVLLGAEFNATIEQYWPSPPRRPRRVERRWQPLDESVPARYSDGPPPPGGSDS